MTAQKWFSRIFGMVTIGILARLLDASDFGLVAVALSVVPFMYLLADLGFSAYLIQAKNPTETDYSTAFTYSVVSGAALAVAMGASGPFLESLLDAPGAAAVMWGLAPAVLATACSAVPIARLRREMRFRVLALQSLAAGVVGQVAAIVLAILGFGVWALVVQTLVTQSLILVLAWIAAGWRPTVGFSAVEFRRMFRFGASVVGVEAIAVIRLWAENAIVAAVLGLTGLGFLTIAQRLIQVAQDLTATAITPVSSVVFAYIRDDLGRLAAAYSRAQSMIYAIVIPAMIVITITAPSLIALLFGEKWSQSVVPAQALALAGILTVGASLDHGLLYGMGSPGRWFAYSVVIDGITVITTATLASHGLTAVAIGFLGVALIATVVRWPLVAGRLQMPCIKIAGPFGRAILLAVLLAGVGWVANYAVSGFPDLIKVVIVGVVVALTWVSCIHFFLRSAAAELWDLARTGIKTLASARRRARTLTEDLAGAGGKRAKTS